MPNVPYVSPEELELQALRQAEEHRVVTRERREEAEKQKKKQEQEEKYKASLASTKALDQENERRLAIALELASKKEQEQDEEDEWSEESIANFCNKKVIVINPAPNSPRSEAILQDLIQSLDTE
jgi:type IV secretory pathway VirB10-like protein